MADIENPDPAAAGVAVAVAAARAEPDGEFGCGTACGLACFACYIAAVFVVVPVLLYVYAPHGKGAAAIEVVMATLGFLVSATLFVFTVQTCLCGNTLGRRQAELPR
ncbi:hypothetical protein ACP70R_036041 [Stipagrostis hirtigluma subsp. patula]